MLDTIYCWVCFILNCMNMFSFSSKRILHCYFQHCLILCVIPVLTSNTQMKKNEIDNKMGSKRPPDLVCNLFELKFSCNQLTPPLFFLCSSFLCFFLLLFFHLFLIDFVLCDIIMWITKLHFCRKSIFLSQLVKKKSWISIHRVK